MLDFVARNLSNNCLHFVQELSNFPKQNKTKTFRLKRLKVRPRWPELGSAPSSSPSVAINVVFDSGPRVGGAHTNGPSRRKTLLAICFANSQISRHAQLPIFCCFISALGFAVLGFGLDYGFVFVLGCFFFVWMWLNAIGWLVIGKSAGWYKSVA